MTDKITWIPTSAVSFEDQVRILRSYVALSKNGETPVHYKSVVEDTRLARTQISGVNSFFQSLGFIKMTKRGYYCPMPSVLKFAETEPTRNPFLMLNGTLSCSRLYDTITNKFLIAQSEDVPWRDLVKLLLKLANNDEQFRAESALEWFVRAGLLKRTNSDFVVLTHDIMTDSRLDTSDITQAQTQASTISRSGTDIPIDADWIQFRIGDRRLVVSRDLLIQFLDENGMDLSEENAI